MLTKESKMRVLENFYAIDYTLFGKSATKIDVCCPETIKEYVTVKGALLSIMVEMNKLVGHTPDAITENISSKDVKRLAKQSAKIARENAQKLVETEQGKADIKRELREELSEISEGTSVEDVVQEKIRAKTFSLALDNLLVARTVSESESYKNLNEVEGQILEDAYKLLRESLVELSIFIDEYANITR